MTVILSGVVGSTAYGLAREGSDVDRLGVFVAPTLEVAGLHWHSSRESVVRIKPDSTLHEVGKYLRLALRCNPTILELLFLPYDGLEIVTTAGHELREMRSAFLSESCIRSAYGGYAKQQADRLARRDDGSFSSNTRQRTTKHARHLLRLLEQGIQLLTTGTLSVRVANPQDYFAFDDMTTDQMLAVYRRKVAAFDSVPSVLPVGPDRDTVDHWLRGIRRTHLEGP